MRTFAAANSKGHGLILRGLTYDLAMPVTDQLTGLNTDPSNRDTVDDFGWGKLLNTLPWFAIQASRVECQLIT